jgi:predicted nucleic acid-binding Zn ribbon protein
MPVKSAKKIIKLNLQKLFMRDIVMVHYIVKNGPLYCEKCGKLLEKNQKKYCSFKCSASVTSKGRKHSEETKNKISLSLGGLGKSIYKEKFCLYCNKPLTTQNKYCDNTCKHDLLRKNKTEKWLKGEIEGTSKAGHLTFVKQYLQEKYDNKCSRCGWGETNPYTNSIPLEVEHIDGNAYNNVTLICPNCQSLTKTYRGANRGNGRRSYLKKYYY